MGHQDGGPFAQGLWRACVGVCRCAVPQPQFKLLVDTTFVHWWGYDDVVAVDHGWLFIACVESIEEPGAFRVRKGQHASPASGTRQLHPSVIGVGLVEIAERIREVSQLGSNGILKAVQANDQAHNTNRENQNQFARNYETRVVAQKLRENLSHSVLTVFPSICVCVPKRLAEDVFARDGVCVR